MGERKILRRAGLVACMACVLVGLLAVVARRAYIRSFFFDGAPGDPPSLSQPPGAADAGVSEVRRLRVVLLDGLSAARAADLSQLDRRCGGGLDLTVDNGFPSVSLPIQHVLWTGLTQQQSGVTYRIPALVQPPRESLPVRSPGSIGVAQSHAAIVQSFGFASASPSLDDRDADDPTGTWRVSGFETAAVAAVAGAARLVFVHVLDIDEAGHAHGPASAEYDQAAERSDELLARLVSADPRQAETRWVVLSDHGHRAGGGHGGAEPSVRRVRACIFGGPSLGLATPRGELQLVDLHRVLAESLGLSPAPGSRARPLGFALSHPDIGATLPTPTGGGWLLAMLCAVTGVVVMVRGAAGRCLALPWWLGVAYLGQVITFGAPTLSSPSIYPPLGGAMLLAMLPALGLATLAVVRWSPPRVGPGAIVQAQLGLVWALATATLASSGALSLGVGLSRVAPLIPLHSAHASWLLIASAGGAVAVALGLLIRTVRDPQA